jgi:ATP-dependent Lon protease
VLFYNNARHKIGLVGFWDTVAFDEVSGIRVKDPDTIQIMKDYMANGRFSRGVEVIARPRRYGPLRLLPARLGNAKEQ